MNWILSSGDFLRVGIIVYVSIWVCMRLKERNADNSPECDVYEVERLEYRSRDFKSVGWVIALLITLVGTIIFPEVDVITQNDDDEMVDDKYTCTTSFNVNHIYVPFYYCGHGCAPFARYISNETDSAFVIYLTVLFNGEYTDVSSLEYCDDVPAHSVMKCDERITNWFEKPFGSRYLGKGRKSTKSLKWTLDLRENAERDIRDIRIEIYNRNRPSAWPDSVIIRNAQKWKPKFMDADTFERKNIIEELNRVYIIEQDSLT